ncbi:lig_chan-Glu_bd domain-containing protein [Trichonephila clavipes]|nr:lig_chan-Glu_bd domain-containing protein [Trichonephila clavipes]
MENYRIAIAPWNPWIVLEKENKSAAHGVVLELYEEMKKAKVFDSTFQFGAQYGGFIGPDGKWNGMIGAMLRNETDIAGPVFMNAARARVVDFAFPLDFSDLVIISGLTPANKNPYLIFGIFSLTVWLLILLAICICAGITYLIYVLLPSPEEKKKLDALFRYLWSFHISLIGKEFGSKDKWYLRHIWTSSSFKLLQSLWFLTCLVFLYVYQGIIVSTYAADRLKPQIEKLEDFLENPDVIIGTYENSYPVLCLEKLANTKLESVLERIKKNLIKMDTGIPLWLDDVEAGKSAYIADTLYSKFMIGERFRLTGKCNIRVATFDLCSGYIALVTRRGLHKKYMRKLDEGILRSNEGRLAKRHILESVLYYEICSQNMDVVRNPLDLEDLLGAFTILGAGLGISVVYFIMELAMYRVKKN